MIRLICFFVHRTCWMVRLEYGWFLFFNAWLRNTRSRCNIFQINFVAASVQIFVRLCLARRLSNASVFSSIRSPFVQTWTFLNRISLHLSHFHYFNAFFPPPFPSSSLNKIDWTIEPFLHIFYSRSSLNGHSRQQAALLTAAVLFHTPF